MEFTITIVLNYAHSFAATWRPVLFNDLYLVLYVCHKVVDGRGRDGVCDPSAGRLYVLGPGESVLGDSLPARLQPALDKMCLSRENKLNITGQHLI